jgi:RNA polymerase sigma factor (sigma-70 family)
MRRQLPVPDRLRLQRVSQVAAGCGGNVRSPRATLAAEPTLDTLKQTMIESNATALEAAVQPATPDVIARLVASHARFLEFLERRVASREVAEDILQEAFVRAITRGESLHNDESAQAWFYRLLRNAIIDHYRRKGAEQRALGAVASEPEPIAEAADAALLGTVCECMRDLIETLKPEYADALREVDLAERDLATFAGTAGITKNNASVRLHRAREALYKQLVVSCGTCATHGCLDCQCDRTQGSGSCHR